MYPTGQKIGINSVENIFLGGAKHFIFFLHIQKQFIYFEQGGKHFIYFEQNEKDFISILIIIIIINYIYIASFHRYTCSRRFTLDIKILFLKIIHF